MANTSTRVDRGGKKAGEIYEPHMWQVHKSHRCRQTRRLREQHPGELRQCARKREINAVKREREPVILCIYKIAAVCNSNDLLPSESSEMASTSLSKCMCDSHRKSGDSDLSDKKECEWAKEVAFYWEEHLHIQLYWELLLHYLPSTSEPLCKCTHRQCMVNLRVCELFISF